jgi:hypothetical protein
MPTLLEFGASHRYDSADDGIAVPVALRSGNLSVDLIARVDTGAAYCVFDRRYAEILGLNVESGRLQRFRTVTGVFSAYEHDVTVQTLGIEFAALVFFAQDEGFRRNLLGRIGWLDRLRIAIIDYERTLHLNAYDS